jgi:hypothetical protein
MKCLITAVLIVLAMSVSSEANLKHGWKGTVHLSVVPFIAGTGIYTDVRMLQTADQTGTKAGAITNLFLVGCQAALGATIFFGDDDQPPVIRIIHHIVGAAVIASSIWLNVEGTSDKGVPQTARYTSYAHTVFSAAPLILLSF